MTRYAVAKGPGPLFFRAPLASPAPARAPPPPFPLVAAVAAAAAMSSAKSSLSAGAPPPARTQACEEAGAGRGRGGGRGGAGPETAPTAAAILEEGKDAPALPAQRFASIATAILDPGDPRLFPAPATRLRRHLG